MAWITDYQRWLSETESLQNAQMVADHFAGTEWTKNSISAMLGNMRHESSINPDMYEYGYAWGDDRGYGLVQWTPRSKYWDWALANGLSPRLGDSQLARIDYEVTNNIQWIKTTSYNLTFSEFRTSTTDVSYLTEAFTWNYERPNAQAGQDSMPERKAFALRCFNELDWTGVGGGDCIQLAQFPINRIQITQGENGSFSHSGNWAMDFVGTYSKYPYYAPCDCELIQRIDSEAMYVWKSNGEVMCADGQKREIKWWCIHEDPLVFSVGKMLTKGELMGHTGVGAFATGDHAHFEVFTMDSLPLHLYDVFAVNGVDIVEGLGYNWRTSDYVDCSGGGGTPADPVRNKVKDYIVLLLTDAVNGWKF